CADVLKTGFHEAGPPPAFAELGQQPLEVRIHLSRIASVNAPLTGRFCLPSQGGRAISAPSGLPPMRSGPSERAGEGHSTPCRYLEEARSPSCTPASWPARPGPRRNQRIEWAAMLPARCCASRNQRPSGFAEPVTVHPMRHQPERPASTPHLENKWLRIP